MKGAILSAFVLVSFSACALPLPSSGPGVLFTEVTEAVQANNDVQKDRNGEACAQNIIGLIAFGDASMDAAKRNGGITDVASIDRYFWSILGVYGKACTRVAGR